MPYILNINGLTSGLPIKITVYTVAAAPVLTMHVAAANIYTSPDTITNAAGCTARQLVTINIRKHYWFVYNKIITHNSNCKNDSGIFKNIDYYLNNA